MHKILLMPSLWYKKLRLILACTIKVVYMINQQLKNFELLIIIYFTVNF